MQKRSVRYLFVIVAAALIIQYAVVGVVSLNDSEPWPAVVLPGFKNVWDGGDAVRIPQANLEVVLASGETRPVSVAMLFDGVPASHHLGIMRTQFQPASVSGTEETERARSTDVRHWLRQRLNQLTPDEQPIRFLAVWSEFHYDHASRESTTYPVDTLVIELDAHADPAY